MSLDKLDKFPHTLVQTINAKIHLQNKLSSQLKRFPRQHLLKSIPKNGQPRRKVTDRLAYVWTTNQNCVFISIYIYSFFNIFYNFYSIISRTSFNSRLIFLGCSSSLYPKLTITETPYSLKSRSSISDKYFSTFSLLNPSIAQLSIPK